MEGTSIALNLLSIIEQGEVLSEYKIRVALDPKQKLSTWNESSSLFTNWANAGGHYDCQVWSPKEDEVDFGSGFLQSRDCLQNQKRTETQREFDEFSGSFRNTGTKIHARTVTEGETQSATGSRRDWNAFSSTYTEWNDFGSEHSYSAWDPEASNQVSDFVQNRGYKYSQEQFEQKREKDAVTSDIREIGLPIRNTKDDARSESRNINVSWTEWTNTSLIDTHSCTTWGPEPGMKGYNESYTQTRGCQEPQVRTRNYKSGSSLINAKTESRSAGHTESRGAIGTGSWSVTSSIYTSWVNSGGCICL